MSKVKKCPVCGCQQNQRSLVELHDIPLFSNVLLPDRQSALRAPRGDIRLVYCEGCGHVYNRDFDPAKLNYSPSYENPLHFSPRFREYVTALAEGLVEKYRLKGKTIVEIGCGKGDFLSLLCKLGENRGLGFDPSYEETRVSEADRGRFNVIRDYYSERYADLSADLVVCRQVLEHVESPLAFLHSVRRTIGHRPGTLIFFEVPNVMYTLMDLGIWDLIYEHCGYFTTASLTHLFEVSGFYPVSVQPAFGGQYICLEAYPERRAGLPLVVQKHDLAEIAACVASFAGRYHRKVAEWQERLKGIRKDGHHVVVWGAGSKGVTFVNLLGATAGIEYMVDINPHKQGLYAPGGGQQVIGAAMLKEVQPSVVLAMNPLYVQEIHQMLAEFQIDARVMVV